MSSENDNTLHGAAFIGGAILLLFIGKALIEIGTAIVQALNVFMANIGIAAHTFAKLILQFGIFAVAAAAYGALIYGAIYCLKRYIELVRDGAEIRYQYLEFKRLLEESQNSFTESTSKEFKEYRARVTSTLNLFERQISNINAEVTALPNKIKEQNKKEESSVEAKTPEATTPESEGDATVQTTSSY